MRLICIAVVATLIGFALLACSSQEQEPVVEVVAKDFSFELPDTIKSGWTKFNFQNAGHAEHFFLLNYLPDSISYERYVEEVPGQFQVVFDSLKAGMDREAAVGLLLELVPAWYFSNVIQMGGTGIISAGMTTEVMLNLPNGHYAMECYIKEQGVFHTTLGMISPLVVSRERSEIKPPAAGVELSLSNFEIAVEGKFTRGENVVAVHFLEHPEVGLGNDVHLARLEEDVSLEELIYWLDWMNIEGLQSPAPTEFLGGVQEMPVSKTAIFRVNLEPGDYVLIAESSAARGAVQEFTIE